MADSNTVVHIGENSPEEVAHKLMQHIAKVEKRLLYSPTNPTGGDTVADRKWILDTYAECLATIKNPFGRL